MSNKEEKIPDSLNSLKKIILDIVDEGDYFKNKDIKLLVQDIIQELDPIIAKHVKSHFREIGLTLLASTSDKIENGNESINNS